MKVKKNVAILELNETSRTYFFPNGNTLVVDDGVKLSVNQQNNFHQITTKQGEVYIVPYRWLAMKYVPIIKDKESK